MRARYLYFRNFANSSTIIANTCYIRFAPFKTVLFLDISYDYCRGSIDLYCLKLHSVGGFALAALQQDTLYNTITSI